MAKDAREHPTIKELMVSPGGYVRGMSKRWSKGNRELDSGKCYTSPYFFVRFRNKKFSVHRLVCRTFKGAPPTPTHTVDHIDGDPTNNSADNLRWATKREQSLNRRWSDSSLKSMSIKKSNTFQWRTDENGKWMVGSK